MRNSRESDIQMALCKYVRLKYPRCIFNVDMSGMNLSKTQSGKAKMMRSSKNFPDFVLYQAKFEYVGGVDDTGICPKFYGALFIELKAEGTNLYKKGGMEYATPHIAEQMAMIEDLQSKGYKAMICVGLDEAMEAVDSYMNM